eukprot:493480-Amphidinium_carterae.1
MPKSSKKALFRIIRRRSGRVRVASDSRQNAWTLTALQRKSARCSGKDDGAEVRRGPKGNASREGQGWVNRELTEGRVEVEGPPFEPHTVLRA